MITKVCSKCKIEKILELGFYKDKSSKSGYKSQCKACEIEKSKKYSKKNYPNNKIKIIDRANKYYDKNKDKVLSGKREYYLDNREDKIAQNSIQQLKYRKTLMGRFVHWRAGAISRKLEWNLSFEDICNIPFTCYYTGESLILESNKQNTISIERVNSQVGYTLDNTVFCCWKVNQAKNNLSKDEFLSMCQRVVNHNSGVRNGKKRT